MNRKINSMDKKPLLYKCFARSRALCKDPLLALLLLYSLAVFLIPHCTIGSGELENGEILPPTTPPPTTPPPTTPPPIRCFVLSGFTRWRF